MTQITYSAEIVGHEPPFKWEVKAPGGGYPTKTRNGTSDSYEDALFAARAAAGELEWARQHTATVRREELFTVDVEVPTADPFDY